MDSVRINPFPLKKLAYMQCTRKQRKMYDRQQTPPVGVKKCCTLLRSGRTEAMRAAIRHGHYECFKHGHMNGLDLPFFGYNLAAIQGRADIAAYCHQSGGYMDRDSACQDAARGGNFECLAYSHANGGRLTAETVAHSVRLGCRRSLEYAIRHGAPWKTGSCALAACSGDLDFVQYCRQLGCPWSVNNKWDWFHVAMRLSVLRLGKRTPAVEAEMRRIASCVDYIAFTADIGYRCAFDDNPVTRMMFVDGR